MPTAPAEQASQRTGGEYGGDWGGDWSCSSCHFSNFRRNSVCKHCGSPAPGHSVWESKVSTAMSSQQCGCRDIRLTRGTDAAASASSAQSQWSNYRRQESHELTTSNDMHSTHTIPQAFMGFRTRWSGRGVQLEQIDWKGMQLEPVKKDFWSFAVHPNVAERTATECERLRTEHSILILDVDSRIEVPQPIEHFYEVPWPDWATARLKRKCFKEPTGIQMQAWPVALKGHDLVGIAETGSGKTLAYILPMLIHAEAQPGWMPGDGPLGLVLVPNRELCDQVVRQVNEFAHGPSITCISICGGSSREDHEKTDATLARGCEIIVATPGNLITKLERQTTNLRRATFVVLDEADELLSEGFETQVRAVMSQVRPDRQVLLFSATWEDDGLLALAREACSCWPIHINVGNTKLAACKDINQFFLLVGDCEGVMPDNKGLSKIKVLIKAVKHRFQTSDPSSKMLVFCNRADTVPELLENLRAADITCAGVSAIYQQNERQETLKQFRDSDNNLRVLVCTQLLGRGHDFPNLNLVLNYDMPRRLSEYVHRIGRTGRRGEKGMAVTLMEEIDLVAAREIKDCLQATDQTVPVWLNVACSKRQHDKYIRMCRDARDGNSTAAVTDGTVQPPKSKGRGSAWAQRRSVWLHESEAYGAGLASEKYDPLLPI